MLIQTLALSLLVSSTPAAAAETPSPADWLDLDAEIETLAASLDAPGTPGRIGGRLMSSYFSSRDPHLWTDFDNEHASGVILHSARLEFTGEAGEFSYVLSGDGAGGTMSLVDAYVEHQFSNNTSGTIGRFKQPVLQAGMVKSDKRLFWDRENNGVHTAGRDLGLKVNGDYGQFHAAVGVMNGVNSVRSKGLVSGRLEYDLLGEPFDEFEGGYRSAEGTNLGLSASIADDGGVSNGLFTAYEFEITQGGFFLGASVISYDQYFDMKGGFEEGLAVDQILGTSRANTSPFTVTSSLLFASDRYELAGRVEIFDDKMNTSRTTFSLSIYDEIFGHRSRILLDYSDVSSDERSYEGDKIEVGFVLVVGD